MIMKFQVTIHGPASLPPGVYEAEVEVTESPDHDVRLVVSEPRPARANIGMLLKIEAKDVYYPDDSLATWQPGELPGAEEVARLVHDVMADTTKHDRTVGWRVIATEAVP